MGVAPKVGAGLHQVWASAEAQVTLTVTIDEDNVGGTQWVDITSRRMFSKDVLPQDEAQVGRATFAGADWEHRRWPGLRPTHAFLTRRGRAIVVLIVTGPGAADALADVRAGFRFLDTF
jgi:hypothetical protein